MKITKLHFKPEESCNCYIIGNENEPCIVIDPGSNENGCLDSYLDRHHSKLEAILITHGHYDHISGLKDLKHEANTYISASDADFLIEPSLNLTEYLRGEELILDNIKPIEAFDEQTLDLLGLKIKVIETPFHTRGSVCYYIESLNSLFSGDTLFHLGIGRYDLPTGSSKTINSSLRKLTALPKETKVYPGHGENTLLGNEFLYNEYFQGFFK